MLQSLDPKHPVLCVFHRGTMGYLLSAQVQRQQHQEELAAQQVAWFRDSGAQGRGGQGFRGSGCRVLGSVRVLDLFGFRDEGLWFEIGVSQTDPLEKSSKGHAGNTYQGKLGYRVGLITSEHWPSITNIRLTKC